MTLDLEAFDEIPKKKSKTKYKAALGVGSVVSLFGIGSTLAANISLNGGGNVEFGQGVATTAACDEDGFSVNPVTRYDNEHSIFRVDYVQVSGLNLTPEGSISISNPTESQFINLGITNQNPLVDSVVDQTDAKLQYPGQYYDGTDWKRTCDNVVLDFKAYTDDAAYALYTDDAYTNSSNTAITSPVMWRQNFNAGVANLNTFETPGFAVIFDSYDDGSYYDYNLAVDGVEQDPDWHANAYSMRINFNNESSMESSNAEFKFEGRWNDDDANASSISKITVQSMSEFPTSYLAPQGNFGSNHIVGTLGNPFPWWL